MKFHLWEVYSPDRISVDIKKGLKNRIKNLIKGKIKKTANKLKINPARLYDYFVYQHFPIPLNFLMNIARRFKIPLMEIEQNIILYKHKFVPLKNSIKKPKLPIEINPYFTSLVANLYFDGSLPRDGKGTYYNQKNKEIMEDFIKKVNCVFGEVYYSLRLDHKGVLKCRIPRIIGEICKSVYNVNSFTGSESRMSKKIFDFDTEHKMVFVLTAIIDEGSISYDGNIMFGLSNKKLCKDVRAMCIQIGLTVNDLKKKKNSNFYYFHIKSLKKLYDIIRKISKIYPFISLRYKAERLKIALEIKNMSLDYRKKFAKKSNNLILNELKNKTCSANYLASKYLISPRTISKYLYELMEKKKINRKKVGQEYYYFLNRS